jgi:hypothetical protein
VHVTVLVADAAEVVDGKLYLLGAGWDEVPGPLLRRTAVAVVVDVPWRTDPVAVLQLDIRLEDADGRPVPAPGLGRPWRHTVALTVTRHADARPGDPSTAVYVANVPPLTLAPGRYRFVVSVDGVTRLTWQRAFTVAAATVDR